MEKRHAETEVTNSYASEPGLVFFSDDGQMLLLFAFRYAILQPKGFAAQNYIKFARSRYRELPGLVQVRMYSEVHQAIEDGKVPESRIELWKKFREWMGETYGIPDSGCKLWDAISDTIFRESITAKEDE